MLSKPVIPVLNYVINYDYITKELCENKEKPEMECNGKCHLKKELADASESENSTLPSEKKQNNTIEILFLESIESFQLTSNNELIQKNNFNYTALYAHLESCVIFHPPIS